MATMSPLGLLFINIPSSHSRSSYDAMEELKMSGSIASYDQLVKQVEALKKENTHLRQELEDNSNHLSKLENETSDMKVGSPSLFQH
ncbi:Adenomatous polyposis coli protein 2, partial [Ophiophagus hannah]